jgi:hypothetical protein
MAVSNVPKEWEQAYRPPTSSDAYSLRAGAQDLAAPEGTSYVSEYVAIDLFSGEITRLTHAPLAGAAAWWVGVLAADWSPDARLIVLSSTFLSSSVQQAATDLSRPCIAVVEPGRKQETCLQQLKHAYEPDAHYIMNVKFVRDSRHIRVDYRLLGSPRTKSVTYVYSANQDSWVESANDEEPRKQDVGIAVRESFREPAILVATDNATQKSQVILDPNPQLKNIQFGDASLFSWRDKYGRVWKGGLYKPATYISGKQYPLVVQTHGFLEQSFRPGGLYPTAMAAQELAATGIIVLQTPECPYSVNPDEAACAVAMYESAVQQLIRDGLADSKHIGILGFSRTCYYVLEMLAKSNVQFQAASITDGVNEGYLQYLIRVDTRGNGSAHEAEAMIGARPFGEGLQLWLKRSPTFNMDKITTPIQVVAIGRASLLFMWEPYAALRFLRRPVDLIVLGEGTHVLTNPAERLLSQGGSVDWFRFWLQDYEDPSPAKANQYRRWRELRKLEGIQLAPAKSD